MTQGFLRHCSGFEIPYEVIKMVLVVLSNWRSPKTNFILATTFSSASFTMVPVTLKMSPRVKLPRFEVVISVQLLRLVWRMIAVDRQTSHVKPILDPGSSTPKLAFGWLGMTGGTDPYSSPHIPHLSCFHCLSIPSFPANQRAVIDPRC